MARAALVPVTAAPPGGSQPTRLAATSGFRDALDSADLRNARLGGEPGQPACQRPPWGSTATQEVT